MESTVFCTVLAALCLCTLTPLTSGQPDTSCVESLFTDVSACFKAQGLDLSVDSGQQDATKLMRETQAMDPSAQCKQLGPYKRAINCTLTVLRRCLNVVNMGGSIPDPHKFQQGMDEICRREDEFDSACLKQHYPHILQCGEDTVKRVVKEREGNKNMNMKDIICLSSDVNYDCSRRHLWFCSNTTRDIYLEQLDKYQVPSACVDRSPGRQRQSHVPLPVADNGAPAFGLLGSLTAIVSLLMHVLLRQ